MLEKLFLSGNVISQFMQVLPISLLAAVVFVYVRRCSRKPDGVINQIIHIKTAPQYRLNNLNQQRATEEHKHPPLQPEKKVFFRQ